MRMKQNIAFLACVPVLLAGLLTGLLAGCDRNPAEPAAATNAAPIEPATASSRDFGDYVLYFNAIRTDALTPEVARNNNIPRSANRALVNISILKKTDDPKGMPVSGKVDVKAVNLSGQFKDLTVREVREGDAVYYLGDVAIANEETLVFTVDAVPANETRPLSVRFQREFVGQ